jgi:hypothetical protein
MTANNPNESWLVVVVPTARVASLALALKRIRKRVHSNLGGVRPKITSCEKVGLRGPLLGHANQQLNVRKRSKKSVKRKNVQPHLLIAARPKCLTVHLLGEERV